MFKNLLEKVRIVVVSSKPEDYPEATPWFERNLFWGVVSGFSAVVLAVVAAMKHDLRWMLILAWPLGTVAVSIVFNALRLRRWLSIPCSILLIGVILLGINAWLNPNTQTLHDKSTLSPKQELKEESKQEPLAKTEQPKQPPPKELSKKPEQPKRSQQIESNLMPKKADLGLEFFGRDTITFNFVNFGNETAQTPKYWAMIMDLTTPYSYPQFPGVPQPLPIPVQVLNDFVRHRLIGGVPILQLNEASRQHIRLGDKLFGIVHVTCLNCDKTRTYWIFFEVGKGGWYSYDASFPELGGTIQVPKSAKGSEEIIDAQVPPNQRVVMPETEHTDHN